MGKDYSMNQSTFDFIIEYEKDIASGKLVTVDELIKLFEKSRYYNAIIKTYAKTPHSSIWYALKRSGNWERVKPGLYQRT
ncbi:hypothetical protein [Domibacillus enclensis]|nr:hypothetical protein [Domibacillus enclensis]SIR38528.1 hypothetical protein SAMN05443094_107212 [Domibacillus enclensis]